MSSHRALAVLANFVTATAARAEDRPATPANHPAVLGTLRPGDTLRLAASAAL